MIRVDAGKSGVGRPVDEVGTSSTVDLESCPVRVEDPPPVAEEPLPVVDVEPPPVVKGASVTRSPRRTTSRSRTDSTSEGRREPEVGTSIDIGVSTAVRDVRAELSVELPPCRFSAAMNCCFATIGSVDRPT
ncbi:MAG: hypothetical protein ACRCZD_17410 [Phycicoccus sp.]